MQVGIHVRVQGWLNEGRALAALAQRAEQLGYAHLGMVDHVVLPTDVETRYPYTEDGIWPGTPTGECIDILGSLCFLAACTSRIRLLSSVLVVPHRPAVLAAKMLATADVLSGGRVIAGVGAGWMREEFEAIGAPPFGERGEVTDDYLAAFRALWEQDRPAFVGRHVRFENVIFRPKPVQQRLPVWVGGESGPALRRTVRFGDAWYPVSNNQQVLLDTPERMKTGIDRLARTAEKAGRDPGSIEIGYLWFKPVSWTEARTKDGARQMFTGSSAQMVEDMAALRRIGVQHVVVLLATPSETETMERIQRFSEEVVRAV